MARVTALSAIWLGGSLKLQANLGLACHRLARETDAAWCRILRRTALFLLDVRSRPGGLRRNGFRCGGSTLHTVTPQFRDHFDADEYRAILSQRISIDAGPGLGWWIIRERGKPDSFHGMALLIPVALEGPEIEIGWRLPRASWRRGYATEAASRIVGYAFQDLALSEIIA